MGTRGKTSSAALEVQGAIAIVRRPDAPLDLTPEETDEWAAVVDSLPADWFARETHGLLKQYPQLFVMRIAAMRRFEEEIADIVRRRMAKDDAALTADHAVLDARARLVTLVAFAAMRHAWSAWAIGEPTSKLSDRLTESFAELKALFASGGA